MLPSQNHALMNVEEFVALPYTKPIKRSHVRIGSLADIAAAME